MTEEAQENQESLSGNTEPTDMQVEEPKQVDSAVKENLDETYGEWFLRDGVKGDGERPDFLLDKYNDLYKQAAAYPELQKKMGAFTGSPDEYKVNIPKEAEEKGFNVDTEHPMFEAALEYAKAKNMNQEGFDGLIEMYAINEIANHTLKEEQRAEDLKLLGENPDATLDKIRAWADTNLSSDQVSGIEKLLNSDVESIIALQSVIAKTRPGNMAPDNARPAQGMSKQELLDLQFAKDEHGNFKQNDPEYRKMVKQKYEEMYGSEPHHEYIK